MENKEQKQRKIIKQELELHLLFHDLRLIHDCLCLRDDIEIFNAFENLFNIVAAKIDKDFCFDITEQYVVTICEE